MNSFLEELEKVNDKETLISLKEQIKNETIEKSLSWEMRMVLYKKIQAINEKLSNSDN